MPLNIGLQMLLKHPNSQLWLSQDSVLGLKFSIYVFGSQLILF